MFKKWWIIMSLTIGLSSSSFFLPAHLNYLISHNQANDKELRQAELLKLPVFYHYLRGKNTAGSTSWLRASRALAKNNGRIASELASYYQTKENLPRAIFWYKQAIKLNNLNARISLATLLTQQQEYKQALEIIAPIANNEQVLLLAAKIAIYQGKKSDLSRLIPRLSKIVTGQLLLDKIEKYQIIAQPTTKAIKSYLTKNDFSKSCPVDIQMFATNLADLDYLEQLVQEFGTHPLSNYLCFENIRYIPLNELDCHHKAQQRIQCNEAIWQNKKSSISTRYVGVLLLKGGANVNSGIMYLDNKDTVDVLAHEVAHLLGFVDEYPLPIKHAKCTAQQRGPFAHNIAVINSSYSGKRNKIRAHILKEISWRAFIKKSTPIMSYENNLWQLGTPAAFNNEVGLFVSDTCRKKPIKPDKVMESFLSYKPTSRQSQLTYFELDFPIQYLQILAADPKRFLMPSFHHNVEIALKRKGVHFN